MCDLSRNWRFQFLLGRGLGLYHKEIFPYLLLAYQHPFFSLPVPLRASDLFSVQVAGLAFLFRKYFLNRIAGLPHLPSLCQFRFVLRIFSPSRSRALPVCGNVSTELVCWLCPAFSLPVPLRASDRLLSLVSGFRKIRNLQQHPGKKI